MTDGNKEENPKQAPLLTTATKVKPLALPYGKIPRTVPRAFPSPCGHIYQGDFIHVIRLLPGISLQVLQQHFQEYLHHWKVGHIPF
jgi:hypothetical protein